MIGIVAATNVILAVFLGHPELITAGTSRILPATSLLI
jgi:hypothetical protein